MIVIWDSKRAGWKNALGAATTILLLPIALVVAAIATLRGKQGAKSSPADLANLIQKALLDPQEDDAWDELECVALEDPELEKLRKIAVSVGDPPWDTSQRATLENVHADLLKLNP